MRGLLFIILLFPVSFAIAQPGFDAKINTAIEKLACLDPNEKKPVTINATLLEEKDSIAVIVKCRIAPGWHIYSYVPPNLPYLAIHPIIKLPKDVHLIGKWENTNPTTSAMDPGVLIYEKEAVFIHKALKLGSDKAEGIIKTGLYYQTCNLRQCLQPVEEIFSLSY